MELRRFEHFIALVEAGSFTVAAGRLYIAQSGLSSSVATLERELGAQLVERTRAGIVLTDAGRAFLEPARAAVELANHARRAAAAVAAKPQPLHIASTLASADLTVERVAQQLCLRHPDLTVDIVHYGLSDASHKVVSGAADAALTPIRRPLPATVEALPLPSLPVAVLCPSGHRLAGASDVVVEDLLGEVMIEMAHDSPLRDLWGSTVDSEPRQPGLRVIADNWVNAIWLVRRGYGLVLGPLYPSDYYPSDVALARLADPPLIETAIVVPTGAARHPALDEFIKDFLETAA